MGSACYNATMTTQQLYFFGCLYLVILAVVAVLTRARPRRIAGAMAGGAVVGVALLGIVAIGEKAGWWHMAIPWQPYFLTLMSIVTIPGGFVFLITWRIARRFGGRGLAVVALVAAVLGPVRDYCYMATFPEWGAYAPGLAAVFAISGAYVILGHGNDAAGRRPCPDRPAGAPAVGTRLMLRRLRVDPEPHFADCANMTGNPEVMPQEHTFNAGPEVGFSEHWMSHRRRLVHSWRVQLIATLPPHYGGNTCHVGFC